MVVGSPSLEMVWFTSPTSSESLGPSSRICCNVFSSQKLICAKVTGRDQRLYKQQVSPVVKEPEPLTPDGTSLRFADGIIDAARNCLITVQEDHSGQGEAVNTIAAVSKALQ